MTFVATTSVGIVFLAVWALLAWGVGFAIRWQKGWDRGALWCMWTGGLVLGLVSLCVLALHVLGCSLRWLAHH